jgi:hypothetical protein
MSSGGDGRLPSQSRSQSQQQRQYDGISNSISSNSLSGSLRKNTLDEQPLQQQQHVRDRSQYAQDPPQDYARYQARESDPAILWVPLATSEREPLRR